MSKIKNIFETNLLDECPHGFCDYIQSNAEVLVVILCLDGFIFFVTLLPPLFSWSNKKPDGRKRIYFAALACFTFYFWLAFLAVNSLYCFGFLAHHGPCETKPIPSNSSSMQSPQQQQTDSTLVSAPDPTIPTFQTLPENTGENPPTRTSRSTHAILQAAASTSSFTSLLTSGPSIRMYIIIIMNCYYSKYIKYLYCLPACYCYGQTFQLEPYIILPSKTFYLCDDVGQELRRSMLRLISIAD